MNEVQKLFEGLDDVQVARLRRLLPMVLVELRRVVVETSVGSVPTRADGATDPRRERAFDDALRDATGSVTPNGRK